ncbi:MAG: hypothetical protein ACI4VF_02280 [Lachnospirales bacterium]
MNNYSSKALYLSKKTLTKASLKKNILTIIGSILTFLFATSVVMSITGYNEEIKNGLIIYVAFLIFSIIILLIGIKTKLLINKANRYNLIFECDSDGVVTIEELTKQTGIESIKIIADIEMLLKKGYLSGCTLQKKGKICVILSNNTATGFINVVCDVCGGTTRLRVGNSGVCQYCGNAIKG